MLLHPPFVIAKSIRKFLCHCEECRRHDEAIPHYLVIARKDESPSEAISLRGFLMLSCTPMFVIARKGVSPDEAISLFQYFWKYPHDCDTTTKDCHGPFRALAMTKKRNYPHNGKERVLAMPDLRDPKELCWHHYYFNVILNQVFVKLITFLEGPKSLLNTPYI